MANYLNKVELLGQLTSEPGMLQGGAVVFSLAVTTETTNFRGEMVNDTCYVEVQCFGQTAEMVRLSIHNGMTVFIDGRLRMDSWMDSTTGRRRSRLYVVADTVLPADDGMRQMPPAPPVEEVPAGVSDMDSAYF